MFTGPTAPKFLDALLAAVAAAVAVVDALALDSTVLAAVPPIKTPFAMLPLVAVIAPAILKSPVLPLKTNLFLNEKLPPLSK